MNGQNYNHLSRAKVSSIHKALAVIIASFVLLLSLEGVSRLLEMLWDNDQHLPLYIQVRNSVGELAGSGVPVIPFFVEESQKLFVSPNYTSGSRCYPFHCQAVPIRRTEREFRIACFGGSTTNGKDLLGNNGNCGVDLINGEWPGPPPFCERVKNKIAALLPDRVVSAYNFGGDGFESDKIIPIMREISRKSSFDLWVIYMVHNEFIFEYDLLSLVRSPIRKVQHAFDRHLALYRIIARVADLMAIRPPQGRIRQFDNALWVETDNYAQKYQQVLDRYEANLREAVSLGRRSGAQVLLSEGVYNYPGAIGMWVEAERFGGTFANIITQDDMNAIKQAFREGVRFQAAQQWKEAIQAFDRVLTIDPKYAPALFRKADSLASLGNRKQALAQYDDAIGKTRFPPVVTPQITAILQKVAKETHTPIAMQKEYFDNIFLEDPKGYSHLFIDDCHPTGAGHEILARRMVETIQNSGLLPISSNTYQTSPLKAASVP